MTRLVLPLLLLVALLASLRTLGEPIYTYRQTMVQSNIERMLEDGDLLRASTYNFRFGQGKMHEFPLYQWVVCACCSAVTLCSPRGW